MLARVPTFLSIIAWTTSALASVDVRDVPRAGGFALVADGRAATIVLDTEDDRVVTLAATWLAEDVERVSGQKPAIANARAPQGPDVIVGSLERSRAIRSIVQAWKLNVADLRGQWESFKIARVDDALVVGVDPSVAVQGVTSAAPVD